MYKTKDKIKKLFLFCVFAFALTSVFGCENEKIVPNDSETYISLSWEVAEQFCAEICDKDSTLYMGGKEYRGGIILEDISRKNENSYITYKVKKETKYISFFLGSVHYSKAYFSNSEVVSVLVDGETFVQETVYNHSLPTFHTICVEGAETVTFKTKGERIISAVGELKAWTEEPKNELYIENENSDFLNISKLIQQIKPYYLSNNGGLYCVYSENGDKTEINGNEYTDAFEVRFPKIEKWSNEVFAYFNLGGKYNYLSFNCEAQFLDYILETDDKKSEENIIGDERQISNSESPFAVLEIYIDDELVFEKDITSSVEKIRIPIDGCKKLCFVWKSVPSVDDLKIVTSCIYAER